MMFNAYVRSVLIVIWIIFPVACADEKSPNEATLSTVERIYGGEIADSSEQVGALLSTTTLRPFCSATQIAPSWLITAAHCLDNRTPSDVTYSNVTDVWQAGIPYYSIRKFVIHPDYRPTLFTNDLALIELNAPLLYTTRATLTTKIDEDMLIDNSPIFMGYGYDEERNQGTRRYAQVPIISVGYATFTGEYNDDFETGACFGDSGGAVFAKDSYQQELIGVISNIINSSATDICIGTYNVTRIDTYLPWITENTDLSRVNCYDGSTYCVCPEACTLDGSCNDHLCWKHTCENNYDCVSDCELGDGACVNNCYIITEAAELDTFESFLTCAETSCENVQDEELFDCLYEKCHDSFYECFHALDCSLLGGDCADGNACVQKRFGLTACIPSNRHIEGTNCDPDAAVTECADGFACRLNDDEYICMKVCASNDECEDTKCMLDEFLFSGAQTLSVCEYHAPHAIRAGCTALPAARVASTTSLLTLIL